jgi:hypothetical protein
MTRTYNLKKKSFKILNFRTLDANCTGDRSEYVRKIDTVQQDAATEDSVT